MHGRTSRFVLVAVFLAAAAPALARAQGWRPAESHDLLTPFGGYGLIGSGITDFTDDAVKNAFNVGGAWDVRIGFGSRFYLGAEAAYVGSFRGGANGGPDVLTNGAEGVVRVQYPYVSGQWLVEPFAFGGVGWNRLSARDAPAGIDDSDDHGVVPFGAGVTIGRGRLLVDARFTYRTSFAENLMSGAGNGRANLDQWAVGASVGCEF
jgi:hypothetical protein